MEKSKASSCWHINLRLLPVKVTFFLLFAALSSLLPYLTVYMRQLGISPGEMAIIISTLAICSAPIRLIVGMVADKLRCHAGIFLICCIVSGIVHLALLWVPAKILPASDSKNYRIECVENESSLIMCRRQLGTFDKSNRSNDIAQTLNESSTVLRACAIRCCNVNGTNETFVLQNFSDIATNHTRLERKYKTQSEEDEIKNCPTQNGLNIKFNTSIARKTNVGDYASEICETYHLDDLLRSESSSQTSSLICTATQTLSCFAECSAISISSLPHPIPDTTDDISDNFSRTFWIFFILFFVAQAAFAPILNILDSLTFMYLGVELRQEYGKQRLWGTVAFGVFVVITGVVMDATSKSVHEKNFTYPFVVFVVLTIVTGFSVCAYKVVPEPAVGTMLKNVCLLLRKIEIWFLILTLLVIGLLSGIQETFFFYFLTTLHSSQLIMGISMAAACLAETFILWFSGSIIKRLTHDVCLIVVFVVFGIRLIWYSVLYEAWWAVATETMHCITFGLLYPTITSYASGLAPDGMQGTAQSLVGAVYFSIGRAMGSGLGGLLYEEYGPRRMFLISAIISFTYAAFLLVIFIIKCCLKKRKVQIHKENGVEVTTNLNEERRTMNGLQTTAAALENDETKVAEKSPHHSNGFETPRSANTPEMETLVRNA